MKAKKNKPSGVLLLWVVSFINLGVPGDLKSHFEQEQICLESLQAKVLPPHPFLQSLQIFRWPSSSWKAA